MCRHIRAKQDRSRWLQIDISAIFRHLYMYIKKKKNLQNLKYTCQCTDRSLRISNGNVTSKFHDGIQNSRVLNYSKVKRVFDVVKFSPLENKKGREIWKKLVKSVIELKILFSGIHDPKEQHVSIPKSRHDPRSLFLSVTVRRKPRTSPTTVKRTQHYRSIVGHLDAVPVALVCWSLGVYVHNGVWWCVWWRWVSVCE